MPLDTGAPPLPPAANLTSIWPSLVGSGKLDTPCARMQSTYARAARYFAVESPALPAAGDDGACVVVVVEPRLAIADDGDPPHAAPIRLTPSRVRNGSASWLSDRRATRELLVASTSSAPAAEAATTELYGAGGHNRVTVVTRVRPAPLEVSSRTRAVAIGCRSPLAYLDVELTPKMAWRLLAESTSVELETLRTDDRVC
jgi:hypothetical protein